MNAFEPYALSVRATCAATSLGRTSVFRLIKAGRLRAIRIGGRTLVTTGSIKALLEGGDQ